jgi:hypothetical protein
MDDQRTSRASGELRPRQDAGLIQLVAWILGMLMIGGAILSDMYQTLLCGGLVVGGSLIIAAAVIASAITGSEK